MLRNKIVHLKKIYKLATDHFLIRHILVFIFSSSKLNVEKIQLNLKEVPEVFFLNLSLW